MTRIGAIVASPLIALVVGIFFLGLSRKITARMQWRYGPPLAQPVIDIVKLFSQSSITHGSIFDLGLILSLAGSLVVVLFLPIGGLHPLSSSGGLLVILYLMLLEPLGIALSGGEAANPNTSIGISRKFILALGYEIPLILILLSVMTYYGTISITEMVAVQQRTRWSLLSFPLFLSGIAYLLILPAILGMRPFEIAGAVQEIASGPLAEYGGKFLALATIQHAFAISIGIALFVNLFLGGASNPGFFVLKMLVVFTVEVLVHAVFPRLRVEQAFRYLSRWPTLLAFAGLVIVFVLRS